MHTWLPARHGAVPCTPGNTVTAWPQTENENLHCLRQQSLTALLNSQGHGLKSTVACAVLRAARKSSANDQSAGHRSDPPQPSSSHAGQMQSCLPDLPTVWLPGCLHHSLRYAYSQSGFPGDRPGSIQTGSTGISAYRFVHALVQTNVHMHKCGQMQTNAELSAGKHLRAPLYGIL